MDGGSRTRSAREGKRSKRTEAGQLMRGLRAALDGANMLGRLALTSRLAPLVSPLALEKRSGAGDGRDWWVGSHQLGLCIHELKCTQVHFSIVVCVYIYILP
jgi:hypothetical protein